MATGVNEKEWLFLVSEGYKACRPTPSETAGFDFTELEGIMDSNIHVAEDCGFVPVICGYSAAENFRKKFSRAKEGGNIREAYRIAGALQYANDQKGLVVL
jgi:hypothetical protein